MKTDEIFRFADECIFAGYFPEINDLHYALLLVWIPDKSDPKYSESVFPRSEIRRVSPSVLLAKPCRVWLVKGSIRRLLGDSDLLPVDVSSGVRPPFIGG